MNNWTRIEVKSLTGIVVAILHASEWDEYAMDGIDYWRLPSTTPANRIKGILRTAGIAVNGRIDSVEAGGHFSRKVKIDMSNPEFIQVSQRFGWDI